MVRWEGASRALAVHQQSAQLAANVVLFHLGNVVRHIINDLKRRERKRKGGQHTGAISLFTLSAIHTDHPYMHIQRFGSGVKLLGKSLTAEESHGAAVNPGVVGGRSHGGQVILALFRLDPCTSQLQRKEERNKKISSLRHLFQLKPMYLTIVNANVLLAHGFLHRHQGVCSDLMPQASRTTVNHDADLHQEKDSTLSGS